MDKKEWNGLEENESKVPGGVKEDKRNDLDAEEHIDEMNLEEVLAQIEHCIGQLENPQISLEDSFRYYEKGMQMLKACNDKVAQIEQKMMVINSRGELEDF